MINRKAIGYITANYSSRAKSALTEVRPLAALPFLGRYRLIDFPLSNMMNADIKTVGVVLPTDYRALTDHLGQGEEWNLARKSGGLFLMPGSAYGTTKLGVRFLMRDIIANKALFERADEPYVVMTSSHIIYNADLNHIIKAHEEMGAGITMVYVNAERNQEDCYRLTINDQGRVTAIDTGACVGDNKFIELFVINRELLLELCTTYANVDYLDLFEAIEYSRVEVGSYCFKGLASGMFDKATYYARTMEMREPGPMDTLFPDERPVMTKAHDAPPAKYAAGSSVVNSFISSGDRIFGTVKGSVLSRNVIVETGAVVEDSIIMQGVTVKAGAVVKCAIVDKGNTVEPGVQICGTPENVLVIPKAGIGA